MAIFDIILTYLDKGSHGILATVIKRTGSAPRDVGAKMFVGEDGKMFGTVGGGLLESEAYRRAMETMGKDITSVFSINMDARQIEDKDMLCGGNVDLLLEPVTKKHHNVYEAVKKCQRDRIRAAIFTRFGHGLFAKSLIMVNETVTGDRVDQKEIDRCMDILRRREPELSGNTFLEPIHIIVPLYIFGAGHVSQYLSRLTKMTGFLTTIIDDRKEFANTERFHDADNIIVEGFREVFRSLEFTGNEYVVIITRSHELDALVLEESLKRKVKYIGMIGSSKKVKTILGRLHEKGFDKNISERINAPIGVDINAETPQEIAVSIIAELVKVKNGK